MEKSRSKRPHDVDEALSSMLWTPYDRNNSTSSDSLSDYEDDVEKVKRYSNPLPNSCNWWTGNNKIQNPLTNRYSFPYYGNYLPPTRSNSSHTVKTISSAVGPTVEPGYTINSSNTSSNSTLVHSFTDEFLQYQVSFNRF